MTINAADILPIANEPGTGALREHLVTALGQVNPSEIRIATAYLTPNGFMELKGSNGGGRQRPVAAGRTTIPEPQRPSGRPGPAQRRNRTTGSVRIG